MASIFPWDTLVQIHVIDSWGRHLHESVILIGQIISRNAITHSGSSGRLFKHALAKATLDM